MTARYMDRTPTRRDWLLPLAMAGLSLVVSGWVNYSSNDKITIGRVVAVETQQKNDGQRLERIENKLDKILERIK
jgi:hypothetical protein